ncbi:ACT domain-containing protein [Corynebacterium uterequi]|uniref:ACT domain-containing protein n=1 Tax=Corynebacterium uterequi TaxID=1072256 RepID=A0A0G3HGV7_9CORY|nr:ACT domain-containing protein [Corynebacterium uterequi]AKK11123.1 ACT domain-containing protein [Corynebacterium uterequi]
MFAIITVTGEDHTGIIASVTTDLAANNANIVDVSQTIMGKWFTMILRVELADTTVQDLQASLDEVAEREALVIRVQSEALFEAVSEI